MGKLIRITIDLPNTLHAALGEMKAQTGASSADTVRHLIVLGRELLKRMRQGERLYIGPSRETAVEMVLIDLLPTSDP